MAIGLVGIRIETKDRQIVINFLTSGCDLLYTIALVGIAKANFGTRRAHRCLTSCSWPVGSHYRYMIDLPTLSGWLFSKLDSALFNELARD